MTCWKVRDSLDAVGWDTGDRCRHSRARGQSLVEFALVLPVLLAIIGGIIQFGLIFWAQNTLTQVVRDTGRWEATQQYTPSSGSNACSTQANADALASQASTIAASSSLLGYTTGEWTRATLLTTDSAFKAFTNQNAIAVAWIADSDPNSEGCSPRDNLASYHVTIKINHEVPVFIPGMQYLPGFGTCAGSPCVLLSSTAQFRMEPAP